MEVERSKLLAGLDDELKVATLPWLDRLSGSSTLTVVKRRIPLATRAYGANDRHATEGITCY